MTPASSNPGILKSLSILHKAMLAGQFIFALVAVYLVYTNSFPIQNLQHLDQVLQVIALSFSAGGFYAGSLLFKKKLVIARDLQADTKDKLALYRQACIIQWALIEGPCIFVILCFLLVHNYAFLALAVVLLLLFALMAPSKSKIALQLQISETEAGEL
jgi:hypothetical protein